MKKRPTSITVIAWIFIVGFPLGLIFTLISVNNPQVKEMMSRSMLPIPVQYVINVLGMLVSLISGIGMLKGKNWSRHIYIYWTVLGFIIALITSPFKAALVPGVIGFFVVVFFMFRPKATEYFRVDLTESV